MSASTSVCERLRCLGNEGLGHITGQTTETSSETVAELKGNLETAVEEDDDKDHLQPQVRLQKQGP